MATCSSKASVSPLTGRKWKIPPPSLLSSTIVSARPSRRAASRPPMSWASATSPISSTTGPSGRRGDAERAGDGAVDAVGAPVGEHAGEAATGRGRRARRRGSASRRRRTSVASGAEPLAAADAATSGSESSSPSASVDRRAAPPRRPRARRSATPGRVPRRGCPGGRGPPAGSPRSTLGHRRGRVLPGRLGVERELLGARRATPARPAAAWRWAGRRPGSTSSGATAAVNAGSRSSRS